jgi:hypothetical protein
MQSFYPKLQKALSKPRLDAYKAANQANVNLVVVQEYAHNLLVAQALLPTLHILEVSLRNGMHTTFSAKFGTPSWYNASFVGTNQIAQLTAVLQKLTDKGRAHTPDYVVAESNFSFWTGFLSKHYETFWRGNPALLTSVFPNLPRHARTRTSVSNLLNPLRELRNDVAHWERVTDGRDLQKLCADARSLIKWLNPAAEALLGQLCQFDSYLGSTGIARAHNASGACFEFGEIGHL